MEKFRGKCSGCMVGVAIGDALGAPVEIYDRKHIASLFKGGVTDFSDLLSVERKVDVGLPFRVGDTTDDWAFTKVLAESLLSCGGYSHFHCAQNFVDLYEDRRVVGMGGTTKTSLRALKVFLDGLSMMDRHDMKLRKNDLVAKILEKPVVILGTKGAGSGVAMRIAPLAIYCALQNRHRHIDYDSFYRLVVMHAGLTHLNTNAVLAGFVCFCALFEILSKDVQISDLYEGKLFLRSITAEVKPYAEEKYKTDGEADIIKSLEFAEQNLGDLEALRAKFCSGKLAFLGVNVAVMALAILARNGGSFEKGVLEAVNSGGDTDTVASIVGGLLGAKLGLEAIPQKWLTFNPKFLEAVHLGNRLTCLR